MKNMRRVMWLRAIGTAVICFSMAGAGGIVAQVSPPTGTRSELTIETDPIRCWWKSAKSAVYIGERFPLTLTCSVVDTAAVTVVVDQSRLDPAAVQLAPFDVVEGTRYPDVQAGSRRFFQYQYSLRVVGDDLFGRDLAIPALDIPYRVQSTVEDGGAIEALERLYRMPSLPVRVTSLVPSDAVDIRDAPADTFGEIQRRRFRANVAFVTAALLFSAALSCVAVAAVGVMRRYRTPATRAARLLSHGVILRHAIGELQRVQREVTRDGWNRGLAGQALAVVRLGSAMAVGQEPAQTPINGEQRGREGALVVQSGRLRPRRLMVSASITAETLSQYLERSGNGHPAGPGQGRARDLLQDLRSTLTVFTAARYRQHEEVGRAALDRALADALGVLRRLRVRRSWPGRTSDAIARAITERRAWPR